MSEVRNVSALTLLRSLGDKSVGAVITDPPANLPWSEAVNVVISAGRVLRPGGGLLVIGEFMTGWDLGAEVAGLNWMADIGIVWNTGRPRARNFGSLFSIARWYAKGGARAHDTDARLIDSNVIVVDKVSNEDKVHESQKPVGLTNFFITLLTRADDYVVDPYCGSGSTLVSAALCGRLHVGSDIDAGHVDTARRRLDHFELEEVGDVSLWVNGRLEVI